VDVPSYNPLPIDTAYRAAAAYANDGPVVWAGGSSVYFSNSVGGEWTFTTAPTPSSINAIHIKDGADYGWAAGAAGALAFYDGNSWYLYSEGGVTGDLNDVFAEGRIFFKLKAALTAAFFNPNRDRTNEVLQEQAEKEDFNK
jgi:hypothetical protein